MFKDKYTSYVIRNWITYLWYKNIREWDQFEDTWKPLTTEEETTKPKSIETYPDEIAGWRMNFGVCTRICYKCDKGKWSIYINNQPSEVIAIFRRFDDAAAIADYIDRAWIKKMKTEASYDNIASDESDIRPYIINLTSSSLPEWVIENEDQIIY